MNWLSKLCSDKRDVTDGLATLVMAADDDQIFRKQLLALLISPARERDRLLGELIDCCAATRASEELQSALSSLKHDSIRLTMLCELQRRSR